MTDLHIEKFDPSAMKPHSISLIIGCRNSGKSVLLRELLFKTRKNYDVGMAMTATEATAESMRKIFPASLVVGDGFDFSRADTFLNSAKDLNVAQMFAWPSFTHNRNRPLHHPVWT